MTELEIIKLRRLAPVSVNGGSLTIGRSSKNGLVLADRAVSRTHCVIEIVDGVTRLTDAGSTRGTRVNGKKVTEASLHDGDRIEVGPFELVVRDAGAALDHEVPGGDLPVDDADDSSVDADDTHGDVPSIGPTDTERETLERLQGELEAQERLARDREATLDARKEEIEHRWQEIVSRRQQHERDRTELDHDRGAFEAERDAQREEIEALRSRVASLSLDLESEQARAGEAETRAGENAEELTSQRELFESTAAAAMREVEAARQRVGAVDALRGPLAELGRRLAEKQRALRALEALWTETDEWVAEAEDTDHQDLGQVVQQRDAVGEQLAAAHAERDELVGEMMVFIRRLQDS